MGKKEPIMEDCVYCGATGIQVHSKFNYYGRKRTRYKCKKCNKNFMCPDFTCDIKKTKIVEEHRPLEDRIQDRYKLMFYNRITGDLEYTKREGHAIRVIDENGVTIRCW